MIVIGVDAHKRSHTLVAVDGQTGRELRELTIASNDAGHLDALRFASEMADDVVWAIEDCRHVSRRLEDMLVAAGERVLRVPPWVTVESRQVAREPGKSDAIDALAVARAVVRDGVERFAVAFLDAGAQEIRLLCDHREQLIGERTRMINRLRFHLHQLDPDFEASVQARSLDHERARARVRRRLGQMPATVQLRIAKATLARVTALSREIDELSTELDHRTIQHNPALRAEVGCGAITAAILIGQTAGAQRFPTDSHFARQAGVAPIPASSGNKHRHRLHRGGNRQLNRALHTIALVRARMDPETRVYLQRQRDAGKTGREAIRCLKRYLARRIWRLLYADSNSRPQRRRATVVVPAPAVMPCTR